MQGNESEKLISQILNSQYLPTNQPDDLPDGFNADAEIDAFLAQFGC